MTIKKMLEKKGVTLDSLIDTALQMYIYDPKVAVEKKMRRMLREEFCKSLKDINVSALIMAGFLLEEELKKGKIAGLRKRKYLSDPVDLIADEILGIGIATYIAGSRSLFEFQRFDQKKPGILKKLPPILDDIIAGLISGVLVKVCSA